MSFTEQEKTLLKALVKNEINSLEKEGKTLVTDDNPNFIAMEEKYDVFLETLLNKL